MPDEAAQTSLKRALEYENAEVVGRFARLHDVPVPEADILFVELKKFLWLAANSSLPRGFSIDSSMWALDEMWHNFMLFSQEYARYGEDAFGRFMHHSPTTHAERERAVERARSEPEAYAAEAATRLRKQYLEVTENLGRETLTNWLVELPSRFPSPKLDSTARRRVVELVESGEYNENSDFVDAMVAARLPELQKITCTSSSGHPTCLPGCVCRGAGPLKPPR